MQSPPPISLGAWSPGILTPVRICFPSNIVYLVMRKHSLWLSCLHHCNAVEKSPPLNHTPVLACPPITVGHLSRTNREKVSSASCHEVAVVPPESSLLPQKVVAKDLSEILDALPFSRCRWGSRWVTHGILACFISTPHIPACVSIIVDYQVGPVRSCSGCIEIVPAGASK